MLNRTSFVSGLTLLIFTTFFIVGCDGMDCTSAVVSSRALDQNLDGGGCWLSLMPGQPINLTFKEKVQITYGTGGTDSFFLIAEPGEMISGVTGATIRLYSTLQSKFRTNPDSDLLSHEVTFHNGEKACLRDAKTKVPLNEGSFCR